MAQAGINWRLGLVALAATAMLLVGCDQIKTAVGGKTVNFADLPDVPGGPGPFMLVADTLGGVWRIDTRTGAVWHCEYYRGSTTAVTEGDIQETMRANNMTREQVMQRLAAPTVENQAGARLDQPNCSLPTAITPVQGAAAPAAGAATPGAAAAPTVKYDINGVRIKP